MIALLDTNVLIASDSDGEAVPDLSGFDDLRVSALSWAELTMGLHATAELSVFKARLARLDAMRKTFGDGVPFDDDCVQAYGALLTRVLGAGESARSRLIDRMIAATAMAHRWVLVSRDRRAFGGLGDDLLVEVR